MMIAGTVRGERRQGGSGRKWNSGGPIRRVTDGIGIRMKRIPERMARNYGVIRERIDYRREVGTCYCSSEMDNTATQDSRTSPFEREKAKAEILPYSDIYLTKIGRTTSTEQLNITILQ
jgi:hypothetical protein